MALDKVTRASLAVLLAVIVLVPMAAPAALAQQPRVPPVPPARGARGTETPVRAFIIDLPGGAPRHYSVVALYRGHVVPVLAIPYPLKPFTAARIKAVIVDGKPLQQLLREDPWKARRLLFEDRNVTVVRVPVKGLAWEPGSKKLLVILPAGEAALRGRELATNEMKVLEANTVAMYRAGDYEIRLVKQVKPLADMGVLMPPLVPIMMNDTVYGYSITIGKARLDIDVTPDRIERLAASATELRPITPPRHINPIIAAAATTSTSDNVWLIPYTEPFTGPNGLPKAMQAIDMPSTAARAQYYNCWTYQPLPFTYTAAASATIVPLTAARVKLTVAIYFPWMPWAPIAEKSTVTQLEANQSTTVTAEWEIPVFQRPSPPKLRVCVYASAEWTSVGKKHANLYVALGGYKPVTLRSQVQPSPTDNTYEVRHQFAVENSNGNTTVATLIGPTTIPVAITPNIAPGPLSFATYIEGGSADFYLGNTHVIHLGHVPPNQFYYRSVDPDTVLATLSTYIISGRTIPLTIEPHGIVKWYAGYTTLSYTAFAIGIQQNSEGNKMYRPAEPGDGLVAAEPLIIQILMRDDGTYIEAGEATVYVTAARPLTQLGYYTYYYAVDVAAAVKPYSYGIGSVYLSILHKEKDTHIDIYEASSYVSGDEQNAKYADYLIWVLGAAGLALEGLGEAGVISGADALSDLLSIASLALSEPHVLTKLTKEGTLNIERLESDTIYIDGSIYKDWESHWRSVLYRIHYTLAMRATQYPVQMNIFAGVSLKLEWYHAWQQIPCSGMGYFEFSPVR